MNIKDYEKLTPAAHVRIGDKTIKFHTPTSFLFWRAETLLSKEPSTIAWLNDIEEGARVLDIGANVGGYTLYAAIVRGAYVDAIEPEAQNFAYLCRNVILNGISGRVSCWPIGVRDSIGLQKLFISDQRIGGSCHSLGEEVDFNLRTKTSQFTQGCYSSTVDQLVHEQAISLPKYIKIDVDGLEHKVLKGAEQTLSNGFVRSLNIELNTKLGEHRHAISFLIDLGFSFSEEQVNDSIRKSGAFEGVSEFVFRRG